jgi:hypothetical protein
MMDTILGGFLIIALASSILCGLACLFALLHQVIAARSKHEKDGECRAETLQYFEERHLILGSYELGTLKDV